MFTDIGPGRWRVSADGSSPFSFAVSIRLKITTLTRAPLGVLVSWDLKGKGAAFCRPLAL